MSHGRASVPSIASLFAARTFSGSAGGAGSTGAGGPPLLYRLLAPPPRQTGLLPLVLLLHGAGERGSDNASQLKNGAAELLGSPDARRQFPCYFVLPQCPSDARWVEVDWSASDHVMPPSPSRPLLRVLELLQTLQAELPIDADRVYIVGLSMGGYGVWDLLSRHPEWFAAAVAICGGGDETQAARMRRVPIWAFHGQKDPVVPVLRSRQMIAALQRAAADPPPRYTEYADVEHSSWVQAFAEPQLLPWLFAQRRLKNTP
jgi:predicted peptidase